MFAARLHRRLFHRTNSIMKIVPVPVREDNYSYLLIDDSSRTAAAIDPYDVSKVTAAAEEHGVSLVAAIITHHHHDHAGGNKDFASKFPTAPIYGGSEKVLAVTNLVKDTDQFTIGDNIQVRCLATPCHTQDSICYHVTDSSSNAHPGGVFTGDTLFIAGCGRFFEGTGSEMIAALEYLGKLPEGTLVYNGHEYTKDSLAFGKHIDPTNPGLARLEKILRRSTGVTGITTIGDEKEWNVFMRLDSPAIKNALSLDADTLNPSPMDLLREQKNKFKAA